MILYLWRGNASTVPFINYELPFFRQEALEAAISERDAQLALLEVSGIKTARAAERADDLKADRKRLMELMKIQV